MKIYKIILSLIVTMAVMISQMPVSASIPKPSIEDQDMTVDTSSLQSQNNVNNAWYDAINAANNAAVVWWTTDAGKACEKYKTWGWSSYVSCMTCASDPSQSSCIANWWTKKFSCEWLFVDKASARICNRNRCVADKWYDATDLADSDNPCNCKYWKNGDGNNVGIPLNTSLPFVGRCVERSSGEAGDDSALNAFPTLVSVATRMLVTVILLVSFIMIVVWWVQWSSGDAKGGKAKITKVIIGIAMLGMMGAILRLINPNFFK